MPLYVRCARYFLISGFVCVFLALVAGCGGDSEEPASVGEASPTAEDGAAVPAAIEGDAEVVESGGGPAVGDEAAVTLDSELPNYEVSAAAGGSLRSIGSDTLLNLMTRWADTFADFHPAVQAQIEGKGSSTAPPALIENQAEFGPMSREMKAEEIDRFIEEYGYEPTRLRVAIDCIAVCVHRDNPIESMTLDEIRRVYSIAGGQLTWGDAGVAADALRSRPITLYGRNSASGTYAFFKEVAMSGSDFKPTVKEQPGSAGVVRAVAADQTGIGYTGIGYLTSGVRAVPVSRGGGEEPAPPTLKAAKSGAYPLARYLYMYVNYNPAEGLDPLREAFIRFVFSEDGQEEVIEDGAYPVSAELARQELQKVGLEPGF